MHIPDGLLDAKTVVATAAISAGALAFAVKRTNKSLSNRQIPFMGVMAAFIFAAQMVNFPIVGGTSGHLIGASLATILFGPAVASIIITTVLFVQCIVFQDGGLIALGANILNLAVVAVYVSYIFYTLITKLLPNKIGKLMAVVTASWASVVSASVMGAFELAASNILPLKIALPALVSWHVFIGLGEGIITAAVMSYVLAVKTKTYHEEIQEG